MKQVRTAVEKEYICVYLIRLHLTAITKLGK